MTGVGRIVVALSLLAALSPNLAAAQKAGVVTTLEGNVTAARAAAAQPVALKFKDDVFVNDRVVTGDRSLARLLLGGKAVVTVRERSALTVTEVPGRSTIDLDSGKIAVAVAKDKMRPGEQIEVRTPNAVAAVRGTVFVVEVIRASASASDAQAGVTVNHYVFTGQIALNVGAQVFNVAANNFASVTGGVVSSGIMNALMRASASGGFALSGGLPKVSGAEGDAKQTATDTTVATFTAGTGLPTIPTPPPPPPTIQLPPVQDVLLPGGGQVTLPPPPPPPTKATGILLFGDTDLLESVPSRANLESDLKAIRPSDTLITNLNSPTLPADLSAYGTIWHVGLFTPLSDTDQAKLKSFLAAGGGIYLTGERPCGLCLAVNSSIQSFLRSVVVDELKGIAVGSLRDLDSVASPFNTTARGGVTTKPNLLGSWFPNAAGELSAISGANVLATLTPLTGASAIVAGVWDSSDLRGGAGRIILMMDVDWLSNLNFSLAKCDAACRSKIVEDFMTFLGDPAAPRVLTGPMFRSVEEALPSSTIVSNLAGLTLQTQGVFALMTDSTVATAGSFLRLASGARIIQTGTDPLVSMSGGVLSVGTGSAGGSLFELIGRPGATQVDAETGLTVGTDRPIQPGAEAPVFEAGRAAVVNVRGSAYKVDTALLEATAPLLNLKDGTIFTTGDNAIDLVGRAKVSIPNDAIAMVTIKSSSLTVNGHFVNIGPGSVLNIAGNLVSLVDGGNLTILNGVVLNVSGGSSATIGRSVFSFSGTGNVVNVTNSIAPTALINGIPVAGPVDSFRIGANALASGTGSGTIRINGVPLTSSTPLASLTGSLIAVQTGGTVKIGQ